LRVSSEVYSDTSSGEPFCNAIHAVEMHTGNSIELRFSEGWKPGFKSHRGRIEIGVLTTIGVMGIITFLILQVQNKSRRRTTDARQRTKQLEIRQKEWELTRENGLFEKLKESSSNFEIYKQARKDAEDFVWDIYKNPMIDSARVNQILLKQIRK
jgi:hypothetical protein